MLLRVWICGGNSPELSRHGCYQDRTSNRGCLPGLDLDLGFNCTVPTAFPAIRNVSSDCIVIWLIRRLCSFSQSFTSCIELWDPTDIRWVVEKQMHILSDTCGFSIATQRIFVGSQIWQLEVQERPKQNVLWINHVVIWWILKYLIGGILVKWKCGGYGGQTGPIAKVQVFVS